MLRHFGIFGREILPSVCTSLMNTLVMQLEDEFRGGDENICFFLVVSMLENFCICSFWFLFLNKKVTSTVYQEPSKIPKLSDRFKLKRNLKQKSIHKEPYALSMWVWRKIYIQVIKHETKKIFWPKRILFIEFFCYLK